MTALPRLECRDPAVGTFLTSYCFGSSSEAERDAIEAHLLICDRCWHDLQELETSVRILRDDARLKPALPVAHLVSAFGLSGRLERPFGGHMWYTLSVSSLYALEYVASIWTELGYAYDRFAALAWWLSPLVFTWVATGLCLGLMVDWKASATRRPNGFWVCMAVVFGALLPLVGLLFILLPAEPTIVATFLTRSAAANYFKNVVLYFLPLLIFIIPTFHSVLRLQAELRSGRHQTVFGLVTRRAEAVAPRGLLFLPMWFLVAVLFLGVAIGILGTQHMLESVQPGPYANLYTVALFIRVGLWYGIALLAMGWYHSCLNELKTESLALMKLDPLNNRTQSRSVLPSNNFRS